MGNALKISEAAILGLHAMITLAQNNDKLVSVKEISTGLDASANHLSKVMQRLTKAELIESIKGYNGGFRLAAEGKKANLLQIYELFDGKLKTNTCLLSSKKCQGDCILGSLVSDINAQTKKKFESISVAQFIK